MTVIAAFSICDVPILLGDLLLTGPNEQTSVALPTLGAVQDYFGDHGWGVSGLSQKVNIISSDCALAWAGSWLGASSAISGLRDLAKSRKLTRESVVQYLGTNTDLKDYAASFIGLISENGVARVFHYGNTETTNISNYEVCTTGSGSFAITDFLSDVAQNSTVITGSPSNVDLAISQALSLSGYLLGIEFSSGHSAETIRNFFGGGYELAFFSKGQIQKNREVTFVFWETNATDQEHTTHAPRLVIRQHYVRDHLLIRSIRIDSPRANGNALRVMDQQRLVIRPMYEPDEKPSDEDLRCMSLQSQMICHCVLVQQSNGKISMYTRVQQVSPHDEPSMTFEDEANHLLIRINVDTVNEINRTINAQLARH